MKIKGVQKRKPTTRRIPTHDYLKYWRVIRYWVKAKYGLSTPDLDMLLFLYSEEMFNKGKQTTLYELTYKAKRIITIVYKKLNGEEIAETAHYNPLFRNDVSYMDKVYRNSIIEMNQFIKQQRHLSQE